MRFLLSPFSFLLSLFVLPFLSFSVQAQLGSSSVYVFLPGYGGSFLVSSNKVVRGSKNPITIRTTTSAGACYTGNYGAGYTVTITNSIKPSWLKITYVNRSGTNYNFDLGTVYSIGGANQAITCNGSYISDLGYFIYTIDPSHPSFPADPNYTLLGNLFTMVGAQTVTTALNNTLSLSISSCALQISTTSVSFGPVLSSTIPVGTQTSAPGHAKPLSFNLINCGTASSAYPTNVKLTFNSSSYNPTTKSLNVTGGAEGVGIQMLFGSTPVQFDGVTAYAINSPTSSSPTLPTTFQAFYIKTGGAVVVGGANAIATVIMTYQ